MSRDPSSLLPALCFRVWRAGVLDLLPACRLSNRSELSGMFRRSASLAIPHHKSFAAIPSVSLVLLVHTNRNVRLSHESQRETALVTHFQDQFLTTNKEKWGKKNGPVFRKVCVFDVSRAVGISRFESVSEWQPHRTIQCH